MYNDYVISKITDHYADRDAVIIYFSDHGEEIYDFRNRYGRTLEPVCPKLADNMFHVPMFVYTTPTFRERHPLLYKQLMVAVDKPIYLPDIPQMLLHIGGLRTKYYDARRDPLSASYTSKGRRILNEVTDYDKLMNNK